MPQYSNTQPVKNILTKLFLFLKKIIFICILKILILYNFNQSPQNSTCGTLLPPSGQTWYNTQDFYDPLRALPWGQLSKQRNKNTVENFNTNVVLGFCLRNPNCLSVKAVLIYQISSRQKCDCCHLSGFSACWPETGDWVPASTAQWSVCGRVAWGEGPFVLTYETINLTCSVQTGGGRTETWVWPSALLHWANLSTCGENLPIFHSY